MSDRWEYHVDVLKNSEKIATIDFPHYLEIFLIMKKQKSCTKKSGDTLIGKNMCLSIQRSLLKITTLTSLLIFMVKL